MGVATSVDHISTWDSLHAIVAGLHMEALVDTRVSLQGHTAVYMIALLIITEQGEPPIAGRD